MRRSTYQRLLFLSACVLLGVSSSIAQADGDALDRLKTLAGATWVCVSWDGEAPEHRQSFRWEIILDGNAIRETMEKPEIGFEREVTFYRDGERNEVVSLTVTNNGMLGHATLVWRDGLYEVTGRIVGPDGSGMEQKVTWELLSDGRLRHVSFLPAEDGWTQRHVLEFSAHHED